MGPDIAPISGNYLVAGLLDRVFIVDRYSKARRTLADPEQIAAMTVDMLEFGTVFITGFTSCAEFGSYAFVHPVIRRLPPEYHVKVEKGLLKTFGRVMPVLMPLCPLLSVAYAIDLGATVGPANMIRWSSAIMFVGAVVSTIIFNVPVNLATRRWNPQEPAENWKEMRNQWER